MARTRMRRARSRARQYTPGATYLITKKCSNDEFLLNSTDAVAAVLLYTLILKALRYGVLIHGFVFMSNHLHLVVTDVRGKLPHFMRDFLSQSSNALKVTLDRASPVWSRKRYNAVTLLDLDAAERKLVYLLANPTRAGLTTPETWPGLTSAKHEAGDTLSAKRPPTYFSKRYQPAEVSTTLEPLAPDSERRLREESTKRVKELLEVTVEETLCELEAEGRKLAGRPSTKSASRSRHTSTDARARIPRFATRNRQRMRDAIIQEREFQEAHAKALERYKEGHKNVVFPHGTFGYHELLGVRVAGKDAA